MDEQKNEKITTPEKAAVILSGGLDSTTLLYDVVEKYGNNNVSALSFNYGQKHKKELLCAKKTCKKLNVKHQILSLDVLNQVAPSALTRKNKKIPNGHYEAENMSQTVVPNRNMCMLSLAAAYAIGIKAKHLFYGAHGSDAHIYFDCRKEFVEKMQQVLLIADEFSIALHAPYLNINKADVVAKGKKLKVPFEDTWSCYKGGKKPCIAELCGTCFERVESLMKNNIKDPLLTDKEWIQATNYVSVHYELKHK